MAIRVVLAEDNYLVREGVAAAARAQARDRGRGRVRGSRCRCSWRSRRSRPTSWSLTSACPRAGGDEGFQARGSASGRRHPQMGVVVLSQFAEPEYALALLEPRLCPTRIPAQGAHQPGRAARRRDPGGRRRRVRSSTRRSSTRSSPRKASAERSPLYELTPTGARRARRDGGGQDQRGYCGRLVITERSVEKYINSIFQKLGSRGSRTVHRRVKAVLLYLVRADA